MLVLFPNQLFEPKMIKEQAEHVVLLEDTLFFGDEKYPLDFHKQKLVLHRASMQAYKAELEEAGIKVEYLKYTDLRKHGYSLVEKFLKDKEMVVFDVVDFELEKRIEKFAAERKIHLSVLESPNFLTTRQQLDEFYKPGEEDIKWFFTKFYIWQRKRLGILIEPDQTPVGGKWNFDAENRKKLPKGYVPPPLPEIKHSDLVEKAKRYVEDLFPNNPGNLDEFIYPTTRKQAKAWLKDFLENRFENFGIYEDAIHSDYPFINHSLLTPMLNIGLLYPEEIVKATLKFVETDKGKNIPLNSLEGFLRQIIGWREFIRAAYIKKGVKMRTTNFFEHIKSLGVDWYTGETSILPIDSLINLLQKHAYSHHIERLMVAGNFMLLAEIHPDQIYKWFMEMYIDAYDWVMVPNVYGMSQFADGGSIVTKPYISSSNYIRKMSNYKKGDWCDTWDALFWRFVNKHRELLSKNQRMNFMVKMYDKFSDEKKAAIEKLLGNYFV